MTAVACNTPFTSSLVSSIITQLMGKEARERATPNGRQEFAFPYAEPNLATPGDLQQPQAHFKFGSSEGIMGRFGSGSLPSE